MTRSLTGTRHNELVQFALKYHTESQFVSGWNFKCLCCFIMSIWPRIPGYWCPALPISRLQTGEGCSSQKAPLNNLRLPFCQRVDVIAAITASQCHCSQPRLPRIPGAQPAGVTESKSGWLWRHMEAVVRAVTSFPRGTVNAVHLEEGGSGPWIRLVGWSLEIAGFPYYDQGPQLACSNLCLFSQCTFSL